VARDKDNSQTWLLGQIFLRLVVVDTCKTKHNENESNCDLPRGGSRMWEISVLRTSGEPRLAKHRSISPRRLANASHLGSLDRCWQRNGGSRTAGGSYDDGSQSGSADANLFEVCCLGIPTKQKHNEKGQTITYLWEDQHGK